MNSCLAAILLIALLTAFPGVSRADHDHSLEQVLVESATTSADHEALARHYKAKAEEAREEAAHHERMAKTYQQGKSLERIKMQTHCTKIANGLKAQAAEYDSLAALHQDAAKASK